jgi:hypothetical protein
MVVCPSLLFFVYFCKFSQHVSVIEDHHQVVYIYINLSLFYTIPPYMKTG